MGWLPGIYYSVFHSVSAFCNAGFDLMGRYEAGSSLMHYETNAWVLLIISLLLVFAEKETEAPIKRPTEKIMIG